MATTPDKSTGASKGPEAFVKFAADRLSQEDLSVIVTAFPGVTLAQALALKEVVGDNIGWVTNFAAYNRGEYVTAAITAALCPGVLGREPNKTPGALGAAFPSEEAILDSAAKRQALIARVEEECSQFPDTKILWNINMYPESYADSVEATNRSDSMRGDAPSAAVLYTSARPVIPDSSGNLSPEAIDKFIGGLGELAPDENGVLALDDPRQPGHKLATRTNASSKAPTSPSPTHLRIPQ